MRHFMTRLVLFAACLAWLAGYGYKAHAWEDYALPECDLSGGKWAMAQCEFERAEEAAEHLNAVLAVVLSAPQISDEGKDAQRTAQEHWTQYVAAFCRPLVENGIWSEATKDRCLGDQTIQRVNSIYDAVFSIYMELEDAVAGGATK